MSYKAISDEPPAGLTLPASTVNPDHITIIKGSTDILLIAPHGRNRKKKIYVNTDLLTRKLTDRLDAWPS